MFESMERIEKATKQRNANLDQQDQRASYNPDQGTEPPAEMLESVFEAMCRIPHQGNRNGPIIDLRAPRGMNPDDIPAYVEGKKALLRGVFDELVKMGEFTRWWRSRDKFGGTMNAWDQAFSATIKYRWAKAVWKGLLDATDQTVNLSTLPSIMEGRAYHEFLDYLHILSHVERRKAVETVGILLDHPELQLRELFHGYEATTQLNQGVQTDYDAKAPEDDPQTDPDALADAAEDRVVHEVARDPLALGSTVDSKIHGLGVIVIAGTQKVHVLFAKYKHAFLRDSKAITPTGKAYHELSLKDKTLVNKLIEQVTEGPNDPIADKLEQVIKS